MGDEGMTISTGGENAEVKPVTGIVEASGAEKIAYGSEMAVSDIPVNLPDKVVVIDRKIGKEIGFVEKADVLRLVTEDARYEGYEDEATGQFMLTYDAEREKAIESEAADIFEWFRVIKANLDTAIGADDQKTIRLGVSYIKGKHNHVCFLKLSNFRIVREYLHPDIVECLVHCEEESKSQTQNLIDFFKGNEKGNQ